MKNWKQKLLFIFAVLSLIVNLVMMPSLPEKMAMQISFKGELQNPIPKTIFIVAAPAILAALYIFSKPSEQDDTYKMVAAAGIIFVVNMAMICVNLWAMT